MSLWCQGFPIVTVPQGDQPKAVTLIKPYYENPVFLAAEMSRFHYYWPAHVKQQWSLIVVDDCSEQPASDVLVGKPHPLPTRLFRITKKARWNWLAARNIGARHARDAWILLTDMDHVVPPSTAEAVIYGKHDPSKVYAFSRIEHTGEQVNPHSASFLMTRKMFWKIGGYEERLAGKYGTDGIYRRRLAKHAKIHVLTDRLVRHEYQADSSTTTYLRKQPEDANKPKIPDNVKPLVLSFPYEEVAL